MLVLGLRALGLWFMGNEELVYLLSQRGEVSTSRPSIFVLHTGR